MSQSNQTEIQARLEKLAFMRSQAFCSGCYQVVTQSHCPTCGSDDFQRFLAGYGVDWGSDWIIRALLCDALTSVDVDAEFEQSLRDCYPETTKLAWIEVDTISALKEADPLSFEMAKSEWVDFETSDERIITFDNGTTYYFTHDIETFLDAHEAA